DGVQPFDLFGDRDLIGRPVQQEEVDLIDLQPVQTLVDRGGEGVGAVVVDPDLGGQEQVVATGSGGLQGATERGFVLIDLGRVEVAETGFERGGNDAFDLRVGHAEDAETNGRNGGAGGG